MSQPQQSPAWSTAQVVECRDVALNVRFIGLRLQAPIIEAAEGLHLDVAVWIEGREDTRSYSIVMVDHDDPRVAYIAVQRAARSRGGSTYMHALEVGSSLRIKLPRNGFPFRRNRGAMRFLAGGIGVTALMSMAVAAARPVSGAGYAFTYVGRHRTVMPFLSELTTRHGAALDVHVTTERGKFDVDRYVASCPRDTTLYVCGPISLLDAVREAWIGDGRPLGSLHYETFGTAGRHHAGTFVVNVPAHDITVTVPPGQSILQALEDVGAEVLSGCRRGECGLCQVEIERVDGLIDHRDVFFSKNQREKADRLCTCVSRIASSDDTATPTVSIVLP